MRETLLTPAEWARAEFASVDVGDERRTKRLVALAAALAAASPAAGTLPSALPDWAQLKAAYRLLGRPEVDHASVLAPHVAKVRDRCRAAGGGGGGHVLLIEDTTQLDFTSHRATAGLGHVGDGGGRGLLLHTTLAVSLDAWTGDGEDEPAGEVVGLFEQRWWARPERPAGQGTRGGEPKRLRLARPRESQRWAACLDVDDGFETDAPDAPRPLPLTLVADREADVYETFGRCRAAGCGWIVRACQDRALADGDHEGDGGDDEGDRRHVLGAVSAAAPVKCRRVKVELRARPGHKARTATLEIRAAALVLRGPWRPGGWPGPQPVNVVEAREVNAPAGVREPLRWVLLTSWAVATARDCRRVVRAYARRWLVEEYHKCLKSGCGVERSQLSTAGALSALLGVLALVALRLLDAKLLARNRPDDPVTPGAHLGPEALAVLSARFGTPAAHGWTHRAALRSIARLGGFLARAGDGEPGWQTIWRGWQRLLAMSDGYALAQAGR